MTGMQLFRAVLLVILTTGAALCVPRAKAQTVSPSLSDSLAADSSTAGLDTDFGNGAGTIGQTFHEDVTDATHSDIFATSMSPVAGGFSSSDLVNASSDSYGQRADALQLSDPNASGSRGGGDSAFRSSAFGSADEKTADGFGAASASAAFRPTTVSGALFHSLGPSAGASGAAGSIEPGLIGGSHGSEMAAGVEAEGQATSLDPALQPVGPSTQLLGGNILETETPLAEASGFFATPETLRQTQFDDGVTPLLVSPRIPGTMVPVEAAYSHAENGFPDSTQGNAESPLDTAEIHAPHGLTTKSIGSLAPDSDGNLFAVKTGVAPNLFASAGASTAASARARAAIDRQFEQSVINGADLAEAESQRRQALQALRSHSSRRSTLGQGSQGITGSGFPQPSVSDTVRSSNLP